MNSATGQRLANDSIALEGVSNTIYLPRSKQVVQGKPLLKNTGFIWTFLPLYLLKKVSFLHICFVFMITYGPRYLSNPADFHAVTSGNLFFNS
jgi:hypothetical protein